MGPHEISSSFSRSSDELQSTPTKESATTTSDYQAKRQHSFTSRRESLTAAERARRNLNAKLANPLAGLSHATLRYRGGRYARKYQIGDDEDIRAFELGAVLAQDPEKFEDVEGLTEEELGVLRREFSNRWSQPREMYLVIILCSISAAVQGMDETVVNGAQIFYKPQFGINDDDFRSTWLAGLTNAAPYLCCALIGSCFWQGFVNTWWHMFIARFALGFGIGPKSATVPIYAAETSPPAIRGALVMQWQMWTAFGIMMGYASDLIFFNVPDTQYVTGLGWRLMMGSAMFPAIIVCCMVFLCPESPRWYMSKGIHHKAFKSMCRLRFNKVQAARDLFYMHTLLEAESTMKLGQPKLLELITVPRNRRALVASEIVMFMQQFCGVNVIAYYSSEVFLQAGYSELAALAASLGFGLINWLFALPAVYTIDTFGRRNLLLVTFPLMGLFLLLTGFAFWIPDHTAQTGCVALGIYLFGIVYSPGEGPVPFTYSAEAYPLYVRSYGMALATATTWFFNFTLAITWPSLLRAFTPQGAFGWYAGWNIIGFVLILLFMPETKGKTLEELDQVFSVPTRIHARWALKHIVYVVRKHIFREKGLKEVLLYEKAVDKPISHAMEERLVGSARAQFQLSGQNDSKTNATFLLPPESAQTTRPPWPGETPWAQGKGAVSVEFETPCKQCFEADQESNVIFNLQLARTNNVCGESDVRLNDKKLNFTWDGANAAGEGVIKAQLARRKGDVALHLYWRSLCIASPKGSIENYAAQILTFTFYPAGQDEGNVTSGFAVSFNSVDKPEILRLITSPVPISKEASILETWLNAGSKDKLQQESLFKEGPVTDAELEEELTELHKLRDQAKTLADLIQEKDERIRDHLFRDCNDLTAQLKVCKSLRCFISATFNLVPDMFRMMKHRFGPLPASLADSPCRQTPKARQNGVSSDQSKGNSTTPHDIPRLTTVKNTTTATTTTTTIDSLPTPSMGWSEAPKPPPSNQLPSRSAIIKHVIRDFAFVSLFVAVMYMLLKHCGNSLSCRRRRVDMLARREERRTLHAYRAAACRYRFRQWWHRLLGREDMSPIIQSPTSPSGDQHCDNIRITSLESDSSVIESDNGTMPNEILGLRRVFEFVGELVNPNGAEARADRTRSRVVTPQDITEITARRFTAGTPAPSSTAPLTTIGSPRTSISILSYETDSEDTVDSLDPETATMVSG
ncbi:proton myo-inositol cotransporter [Arthroderma uncinatum]|uniref:proton myo-inositol cotransporter n=1 Tax=Arthroderma uncinatum TaxID=74035 RepID=UPI00144A7DF7|nr:proton myo-inositol cotransporter [Arthroderma uncinatum]KAF3482721.1 proton myo-inositol cotransporter [Arthroderma uncinatum]